MTIQSEHARVRKLDSVRGIAAMMVVVGHCYGEQLSAVVQGTPLWPLQILWDGLDAVNMFFILSGYVLALQISAQKVTTYTGFAVRRFFSHLAAICYRDYRSRGTF
jgi:peptidoglycan/LPS O-acetylase OafA/YrhL